ncbi:unnamed protein product [Acanthoscelides obtectus]|uniref:Phosphatidylinositol-glycan biosynthesis class W protein n=1 Tax=Acanthoscelides obtectus TaxID=200917 RepID=A0A9P0LG47_ACAOB|nr:unnamed protein product [Acanthoscelides obtectus]CAK1673317.1 Uncharacterized protein At4g17910 [Acanthoscelides obtectus]
MTYKSLHTPDGTTPGETFFSMLAPLLAAFTSFVLSPLAKKYISSSNLLQFALTFVMVVFLGILTYTLLTDYLYKISTTFIIILASYALFGNRDFNKISPTNKTDYITNHRSLMFLLTMIIILAVDFKIFPRRYAKTGCFGYSLMDAGVGLFIFSNGIVSPEARRKKETIKKSIRESLCLIFLGFIRLVSTVYTSYTVPVSEYGVHWNFFITLAMLKVFSSFILTIFSIDYVYLNATLLIIAQEVLLESGLAMFVLENTERTNLIKANKEGLVSMVGYLALYLYSVYFGYIINKHEKISQKVLRCIKYAILSLVLHAIFTHYFGTSRRLANAGYCFWVLFLGIYSTVSHFLVQEYLLDRSMLSSFLFYAINYNGLVFFLLANVLTGLVNLSIDTNSVGSIPTLVILTIYSLICCGVVSMLYNKKIKVKI